MNKKGLWGITVLAAVIAMGLAFTACPPDNAERTVTFENNLRISVSLDIQGEPPVDLPGLQLSTDDPTRKTVTKKGEDIVLQGITFGNPVVDAAPDDFVILRGTLIGGTEKRGKQMKGIPLAGGTLIFAPDTSADTAKIVSFKIGSPLGEE